LKKMAAVYKYAIEISYSEEDEGYIATVSELPGCSAFGNTEEVKIAMELWLKTAQKEGTKIPQPHGKELLKELIEKQHFQTTYGELA